MNISEQERATYNGVVGKFDEFFKIRCNVIFERARFNRHNQLQGESSEQYIAVLSNLAETCEFQGLKDEMIRDRLVVGIRDQTLSERLQMDPTLEIEKLRRLYDKTRLSMNNNIFSSMTAKRRVVLN